MGIAIALVLSLLRLDPVVNSGAAGPQTKNSTGIGVSQLLGAKIGRAARSRGPIAAY